MAKRLSLGLMMTVGLMLGSAPALAAKPEAVPPPPKKIDEKGVNAWVDAYIEEGDWVHMQVFDQSAAYFVMRKSIINTKNNTVRFWIKGELFSPFQMETAMIRSYRRLTEVGCADMRYRRLAYDAYPQNNLLGDRMEANGAENPWEYPRPDEAEWRLHAFVCEYADALAKGEVDADGQSTKFEAVWKEGR